MTFAYEQEFRVSGLDGDPAALGGAVTVALCGHWEHNGQCRWPHHNETRPDGDGYVVTVSFDAAEDEIATVRSAIAGAVASGELTGPDGRVTRWTA